MTFTSFYKSNLFPFLPTSDCSHGLKLGGAARGTPVGLLSEIFSYCGFVSHTLGVGMVLDTQ